MAAVSFDGQYELLQVLGAGAYGTVYSAAPAQARSASESSVAVKVMKHDGKAPPRMLLKEIEMLQAVAHIPHCVKYIESYFENSCTFIVMEMCDRPLSVALYQQPVLSERVLATFIGKALAAVAAIHDAGVVHCDVKPEAFMCHGTDNAVKLVDFGLATWAPRRGEERLGQTCGTPPFMAPEILGGVGYGMEIDVWAVGVTAYVLMLGHFPYMPAKLSPESMKEAIRTGSPPPSFGFAEGVRSALGVGASVSDDAASLLRLLLERDATARPTAEEALQHRWLAGRRTTWALGRRVRPSLCLKPALAAAGDLHAFVPMAMERTSVVAEAPHATARGEIRCASFLGRMLSLASPRPRATLQMACDEPVSPTRKPRQQGLQSDSSVAQPLVERWGGVAIEV